MEENQIIATREYPGVATRVRAIIVDAVIVIIFMVTASYLFSLVENVPDNVRIGTFIFIFILYDPLFTSFLGGTIGHMIIGIRVKKESNEQKNIFFHEAIIRYLVKSSLGWISLLTVTGHKKKKAIHDHVVGSVVVYAKPDEEEQALTQ